MLVLSDFPWKKSRFLFSQHCSHQLTHYLAFFSVLSASRLRCLAWSCSFPLCSSTFPIASWTPPLAFQSQIHQWCSLPKEESQEFIWGRSIRNFWIHTHLHAREHLPRIEESNTSTHFQNLRKGLPSLEPFTIYLIKELIMLINWFFHWFLKNSWKFYSLFSFSYSSSLLPLHPPNQVFYLAISQYNSPSHLFTTFELLPWTELICSSSSSSSCFEEHYYLS